METHECRDDAEPLAPVVEHANGDAEVEVPVIETEHDLVCGLFKHPRRRTRPLRTCVRSRPACVVLALAFLAAILSMRL